MINATHGTQNAEIPIKFDLGALGGPEKEASHPSSIISLCEFCRLATPLQCRIWSSAFLQGPTIVEVVFTDNEKFVGQPREDPSQFG